MDRIYSRKRVKLPRLPPGKYRKIYYFIIIWIMVVIAFFTCLKYIVPPFEVLCVEETKKIGTVILNEESTNVLKNVEYTDLVQISKDSNEKITMVNSNVILINLLASDITSKIQSRLDSLDKDTIKLPMGVLTGMQIFAGSGPDINIEILPVGNVETHFYSDFKGMAINQTMHRLYLDVTCKVSIITPYGSIDSSIENQILFAENIIVGEIPDTFYNLEGLRTEDVMEVVN